MAKAPKPTNTAPGLIYMLEGGSDISATDPFATKTDHYVSSPAHYMIMWPFDAKSTGFVHDAQEDGDLDHVGRHAVRAPDGESDALTAAVSPSLASR